MKLSVWDPFREMEDLLDRYARSSRRSLTKKDGENMNYGDWMPAVDIQEKDGEYIIKAEIPGVKKDDVSVSIENGVLTIKGEKKIVKEEKDKKNHLIECSYGSFIRSFTLPIGTSSDKIDANYRDGILTLVVPKSEEVKPKQIEIKIK